MYDEADYSVVVSGTNADGEAGAWATVFGSGSGAPPGSWHALVDIALASPGTDVTYLATGAVNAAGPRALLVETYEGSDGAAGADAFDRVQIADAVAGMAFDDYAWRDPRPFAHASEHGLAIAARGDGVYLCAPAGVWYASTAASVDELTTDVIEARVDASAETGRARLTLRNDDGRYHAESAPAALAPGGELAIEPGYVTAAGEEVAAGARYWITSVRRARRAGVSIVEVEAAGAWERLAAWRAARQFTWAAGEQPVFLVLLDIARRAGLGLATDGASGEVSAWTPAYSVRPGERGDTAFGRLLGRLPDAVRVAGTALTLYEPRADDAPDYTYGDDAHPVAELTIEDATPSIGRVRVFGEDRFVEAFDASTLPGGAATAIVVDDSLDSLDRVEARATAVLRRAALQAGRGGLIALPNVAHEVGDVIEVTDATLGLDAERFRIASIALRLRRGGGPRRTDYTMTLGLAPV